MRTFDPWIGSKYRTEGLNGLRLLILGEAHYGNAGNECQTETTDVIRRMALQKDCLPFFSRLQHVVLGTRGYLSDAARKDFWERIAFYNFIQCFPRPTSRIRPTPTMWLAGREPLLLTIKELDPSLIVVLGVELARNLPPLPPNVVVCRIRHPSAPGFSYARFHPVIKSALEEATRTRFPSQDTAHL
jgi:hypothetical protein